MSNATVNDAMTVRGTDPQFLVEKIIRTRIYESMYWKESCFGLTAESLIERAVDLQAIGGQYANQRPTEFLCLTLKLLQLQPSKDIVIEFLKNEDFKYLRALAALYIRLVGTAVEIYEYLEPLFNDFRKLRIRHSCEFGITYMDDFVDQLLREERVCDIILPRLPKRYILEENDELPPRISILEEELDDQEDDKLSDGDKTSSDSESSDSRSRSNSRRGKRSNRDSRIRDRSTSSRSRSDSDCSYSRRRRSRSRSRGRAHSRRGRSRSRSSSSAPRKSRYHSHSSSSH